jgi:hypothetical protein
MLENEAPDNHPGTRERRQHERIAGPFDACRIGALDTPLRVFNLSRGGCFITAMHEQKPGIRFLMKIDLPAVGEISVKVETVYRRSDFGYAVRFVDMDDETAARLDAAIEQLLDHASLDA